MVPNEKPDNVPDPNTEFVDVADPFPNPKFADVVDPVPKAVDPLEPNKLDPPTDEDPNENGFDSVEGVKIEEEEIETFVVGALVGGNENNFFSPWFDGAALEHGCLLDFFSFLIVLAKSIYS